MDTDTNPPDDPDPDDLDGLAASLDDLTLWCGLEGPGGDSFAKPTDAGTLPAFILAGDCVGKRKGADEDAP
jgi:hypothetical protein